MVKLRVVPGLVLMMALVMSACSDLSKYPQKACGTAGAAACQSTVGSACSAGVDATPGCLCSGKACTSGSICEQGACNTDSGQPLNAPAQPQCYTPCKGGGLTVDGIYVACSVDGLVPGCIDGSSCVNGTCISPRSSSVSRDPTTTTAAGACAHDADCPDFQACIGGTCYSDCTVNDDCRGARQCFKKVCRIPCTVAANNCLEGTSCVTSDGVSGFCLPQAKATAAIATATGSFTAAPDFLRLSNTVSTSSFVITNNSSVSQTFTVSKAQHTEFADAGPTIITQNALSWISLALGSNAAAVDNMQAVAVPANSAVTVTLSNAANPTLSRYDGVITVSSPTLGKRDIGLSYVGTAQGQWAGTVYFLSNFGEAGLANWVKNRDDQNALRNVGNALVRRWGAFRSQRISLEEFKAVLTATQTESWKFPTVVNECPNSQNPNPNVGCYLYSNAVGLSVYSDFLPDNPIPTGVTEFPITFNLHASDATSKTAWSGKIVSEQTLQYAGSPALTANFADDPDACAHQIGGTCITFMNSFDSSVYVGGRFLAKSTDTSCSEGAAGTFSLTSIPWLVPGFLNNTTQDPTSGANYRYECHDQTLPFGNSQAQYAINEALAAANPVPDGNSRKRIITLIDGAIINQDTMFVLFREQFPSFLNPADTTGFSAYGYMLLSHSPKVPAAADYQGATPVDFRTPPSIPPVSCSAALVAKILAPTGGGVLSATTANAIGVGDVSGVVPTAAAPPVITSGSAEKVHYYCPDTGFFDGGPNDNGTAKATQVPCPAGSQVKYFTIQGSGASQAAVAALACQTTPGVCNAGEPCDSAVSGCTVGQACATKGACGADLATWRDQGTLSFRGNPVWACTDPTQVYCATNRNDLRANKTFYSVLAQAAVFRSLDDEIIDAFRYKTRFANREGTTLAFAPQVCDGTPTTTPYCYDPVAIDEIRDRVDCATAVYSNYYTSLSSTTRSLLKNFLVRNYAYSQQIIPGLSAPLINDGFEKDNAELLIMLGDDAYTSAFSARFDLAGQRVASFQGTLFEPNGLDLSGGAGFEMYKLYQAVEYYQYGLDRFYALGSLIWTSLATLPPGQGFITQATTTSYFDKLIRASSQKAAASNEIAKRYLSFNRADLARLVVGRAYTSAYLESVILSRMMLKVIAVASPADQAQIVSEVENAQLTYRAALLDMRNVYQSITDNVTVFGFDPGYVPFPALEPGDTNAFDKVMASAQTKMASAKDKEQVALSDTRAFDTDTASFQNELSSIISSYEGQLADICGTFIVTGANGTTTYPAIPKYAYLDARAALMGNPCGKMGNGSLNNQAVALEQANLDFEAIKLSYQDLIAKIADTQANLNEQCQRLVDFKNVQIGREDEKIRLNDGIDSLNTVITAAQNAMQIAGQLAQLTACTAGTSTNCPTAVVAATTYGIVAGIGTGIIGVSQSIIDGLEHRINTINENEIEDSLDDQCTALSIDGKYRLKDLWRQSTEIELQAVKEEYSVKQTMSDLLKQQNDALGLISSEADALAPTINLEAARNDPNVRIYKNDAIYNAELTFEAARNEAYRATKVYEFYTSQSYAAQDKLFLVRMVSSGDVTLEQYLADLQSAFDSFQEQFGNPDTRVEIISVRDDVLKIPRLGTTGVALTDAQRTDMFRKALGDAKLLDNNGYINMPFATGLDKLSPLTRNHKVLYAQAELLGTDTGDQLGRLYLSQTGTGTVHAVDNTRAYYAFPARTAVVNTFFNGQMPLDPAVYKNDRLRDRPLVNTAWSVVLNQKNESVNQDIQLGSLTDIRLYLYYTDFTQL